MRVLKHTLLDAYLHFLGWCYRRGMPYMAQRFEDAHIMDYIHLNKGCNEEDIDIERGSWQVHYGFYRPWKDF